MPKLVNEAVKKEVEEKKKKGYARKKKKFANSNVHLFRGPQRLEDALPTKDNEFYKKYEKHIYGD